MKVSIIVIGDELLLGQVTDTNSGDIARHIAPYGWEVNDVQTVGDEAGEIRLAIDRAFELSDVVLTTGGLGPTKDDITKTVMCDYFGGELKEDPEVLANVLDVVSRRGFKINKLTAAQAIVPTSCRVIQNRVGTAPIMWFEKDGKVLVSLPGVPFETREMFTTEVFPQLCEKFRTDVDIEHAVLMVTDYTESGLAEKIAPWEEALPEYLHLAYLPKPGLIRLRIDGAHRDKDFITAEVRRAAGELVEMLGDAVIATDDLTPAEILLRRCRERGLKLATAESCTGGNIAHEITLIAGSSDVFAGSVVSYSNEVKMTVLGVGAETLEANGAVSLPVVREMAEGALRAIGAQVAVATSGIAGPGGGSEEKPVGTVCMAAAVVTPDGRTLCETETHHFPGNRRRVIEASTTRVLIKAIKLLRSL
ncbi:MAG: CinA family nicotinamide mononucleotide deamidase-related protein [Duncaniella sp.]|uniref:CinA family nicotinamide mononucleotide deamidase-related protein n=1 Tax=Duncaniella sp. TaxID=2518496 RepID=UPI0023CF2C8A|nr:CinA family nicotinamide mononucleotide deamidase-related protein [Duncaniella sp.]MDE5989813.1 CinA family nicotinamide mononucleotide deamidase-related protein [Duncaniella sp.]